jgi:hypothetical protein
VVLWRNPPEKVEGGTVPEVGKARTTVAASKAATAASNCSTVENVAALPNKTPVAQSVAGGVLSKVIGGVPPGGTMRAAWTQWTKQAQAVSTATSPSARWGKQD